MTTEERQAKIAEITKLRESAKREGFWKWEYEPTLPIPIPNVLTEEQAQEIYNLIVEKQKECHMFKYMGLSESRITGESLGCTEYEMKDFSWKWPGDFVEHYVLQHKVKPTNEFLEFIGYKEKKENDLHTI